MIAKDDWKENNVLPISANEMADNLRSAVNRARAEGILPSDAEVLREIADYHRRAADGVADTAAAMRHESWAELIQDIADNA